ncbi:MULTISPECIES: 30S ribosomal protein S9 [unclassified Corynebacterium]|uniref:30S ribosomal protein S9 n=1 Tax=unclassified Corynebacterium TaxID=2624378 RepID=UPI0021A9E673|nr:MULTISPECIES: 30S ribosomal protein S9 [unclassified Corynebacterium]MCT1452049.1 30S ribosomal protein S9 [Corynebacterium sp. p3-SID1145]MCT1460976.1 30S ribosomal protein S9 [Corynebacterium sp. p3-SID1140]MDN8595354.1 30S ribosomal protein S9 [Corynebacterium sp. P4_F2]WKK54838.1 30S ribosomal protein S9 [Corynebacterium sp. P4-C1]WKK64215.1 30S ribosomal protein S9 [Corynebacterium sp. P8-C1]
MTEPNNITEETTNAADQTEGVEATQTDIDAATAATEEFNYTIGDAVAVEDETQEETVEVASFHEGPIQTVGRRKRAIARVTVVEGEGKITVNGRELEDYFPNKLHQQDILAPLTLLERENQFDIKANIGGGGPTGQAGALRLAIARALNIYNPAERPTLKKAGYLTRDARAVERKKAGLHKARRAPQYSKR